MKEEARFASGIAYLYTIIVAVFTLIPLLLILFYSPFDKYSIKVTLLQFGFFALILGGLYTYNKTQGQSFRVIVADVAIRKATGAVIFIIAVIGLFTYIPSVIYGVTSVVQGITDSSVILTFVSLGLILCQIAVGIYLLKHTSRTNGGFAAKTVIGIAFCNTLISAVFKLVTSLTQALISRDSLNVQFLLWLGPVAVILIVLWFLNIKHKQSLISAFRDRAVRKATGALLIINGLLSIAAILNSVINTLWINDSIGISDYRMNSSITWSIVKFIIVACQIVLGLYLLRAGKKSPELAP